MSAKAKACYIRGGGNFEDSDDPYDQAVSIVLRDGKASTSYIQRRLGVGYNHEINTRTDLLTRVAYQSIDFGRGLDASGYAVEVGARSALLPALEGYALAGYEDYGSGFDSEFYGRLGAQWTFTQNFGVAGDVKLVRGGDRQWFVGPRLRW